MALKGALQIKTEPISAVRGGNRRPFQRNGRGAEGGTIQVDRIEKVLIAIRVVLHRITLRSGRREMPRVFLVKKPYTTIARAEATEQQGEDV